MAEKKPVVCFPFTGDLVGGSHVSAMGLIKALDRDRFTPLVVLHSTNGPLAEFFRQQGLDFEAAPVSAHPEFSGPRDVKAMTRFLRLLPPIMSFLRSRNIRIVHTNDGRVHATWGLAAKLSGVKLLWHHRSDPNSFGLRWMAPWLASHIVSVSRFAGPRPGRIFNASRRSSVVHSPFESTVGDQIDRPACRAQLVSEIGCPADTFIVGYVGALVNRKRPLVFVDTIAALRKLRPGRPVAGVLFGDVFDGMDAAVARRAEALGVQDHVHFLGFRYPGTPWIAALDALLVTAVDEPFGRTLIEAMLVGTPVIAADSGGNPEAIVPGKNGLLVQPDDPDAFARALAALMDEPGRKQDIADTAFREARVRFGVPQHVRAISDIYDRLLS